MIGFVKHDKLVSVLLLPTHFCEEIQSETVKVCLAKSKGGSLPGTCPHSCLLFPSLEYLMYLTLGPMLLFTLIQWPLLNVSHLPTASSVTALGSLPTFAPWIRVFQEVLLAF
jgi:hypothetical protein